MTLTVISLNQVRYPSMMIPTSRLTPRSLQIYLKLVSWPWVQWDNTVCPVDSSVQQLQPKGPDATPPPQLEDVQCDRRAESLAPLVPHAPPTLAALAATPARRGVSQRMPAHQPRRSMRDHPNSFAMGFSTLYTVMTAMAHHTQLIAHCTAFLGNQSVAVILGPTNLTLRL